MGLLDSIFGGGSGSADDPYADILTPAQRNHMQAQGLLAMAGAFAQAGMPSRLPVPFGSALGSAAAALGTGQEAGMTAAIANAYKAQQVRDLRAKAALQGKLSPIFQDLLDRIRAGQGVGPGAPAIPQPAGGGAAPPVGAGDGGDLPPMAGLLLGSEKNPEYISQGLAPKGSGRGLLAYPEATDGLGIGGGGLLSRDKETLGTATPSSEYAPGGSLYPFKDLGVVPGATGGGAPAAGQSGAAGAPTPVPEVTSVPGGTNGIDPRKRAALDAILGGMQTAQAGPSAGRLPQFAGPGAADAPADTVPEGGGLLGVAPDLRAPIDANPFARSPSPGDPRGVAPLIRQAALRYGVDPDVALKVARSEGLGTFLGDRGKSGSAFQLYTGGGLGNEFQKQTGLDPLDPANEPAAIDWALRNVNRTGWSPYHGAANVGVGPRTGLPGGDLPPPDEVIPSGPGAGGGLPVTQAQYRPQGGGAAVPGMPQLAAPNSLPGLPAPSTLPQLAAPGAAPALGAGGKIPGLNMTPQELAVIDAMAEAAGLGNPFKGLLDTYYKSPGYLQESAGATARGRIAEEEPSKLRTDAAAARLAMIQKLGENALTLDKDNNVVEIPGMRQMLGKTAAEIEKAKQEATSQFQTVEATVLGPNGERTPQKMTQYEFTYREQQRAKNAAMGLPAKPGDIVSAATPESTKSAELGVTAGWKALETTHAAELAANRSDQQLGQIAQAMKGFTPGKTAEWRLTWGQYLKDAGFKIDGVSDGEIMQQAQRRLQIAAANVHEGSVSNFERSIFGETVTQLTNTPEGIVKAIEIQQRLNDYDRKVAQIHRDTIVNGVPNIVEAQKRIAQLGSPLSPGELSALQEIRAGQVPGRGDAATAPAAGGIDKATYDRLPSGATYTAPDGTQRTKP